MAHDIQRIRDAINDREYYSNGYHKISTGAFVRILNLKIKKGVAHYDCILNDGDGYTERFNDCEIPLSELTIKL